MQNWSRRRHAVQCMVQRYKPCNCAMRSSTLSAAPAAAPPDDCALELG